MNILVCVKQVPDISSVTNLDSGNISIENEYLTCIVNPYDMLAVEEAVRIREKSNEGQVILLSLGRSSALDTLRECLSLGADKAILLSDADFDGSDSYSTAVVLAEAIKQMEFDLILCGVRAVDTNAGQVGSLIASMLDIPLVSAVTNIDVSPGSQKLIAHRKLEGGNREVIETSLPALLTVEAGINVPRYASLPVLIAAQRKTIEQLGRTELGLAPEQIRSRDTALQKQGLSIPKPRPKKLFTPDSNLPAAERMRLIMSGGISEKKTDVLQGNPAEIAANLLKYLKQEKIVP